MLASTCEHCGKPVHSKNARYWYHDNTNQKVCNRIGEWPPPTGLNKTKARPGITYVIEEEP